MTDDTLTLFERQLVERACTVQRREHDWSFDFGGGCVIDVGQPWRVIAQGAIAVTDADDGHMFGRSVPLDVEAETNRLLAGQVVASVAVDGVTADLRIVFANGSRIDVFHHSNGYEGWSASFRHDGRATRIIALGGGRTAIF